MDASCLISEPQALAKYAIHGIAPASAAKPRSAQEAAEIVRFAAAEKLAVIPCGNRSKLDLGATPLRYDIEFPSHAEVFAIVQFPCDDMFG